MAELWPGHDICDACGTHHPNGWACPKALKYVRSLLHDIVAASGAGDPNAVASELVRLRAKIETLEAESSAGSGAPAEKKEEN